MAFWLFVGIEKEIGRCGLCDPKFPKEDGLKTTTHHQCPSATSICALAGGQEVLYRNRVGLL
jgi:hypothetical protein